MARHPRFDSLSSDSVDDTHDESGLANTLRQRIARPTTPTVVWTVVGTLLFSALGAGIVLAGSATYESRALLLIDEPQALAQSEDAGVIQKLGQLRFKYLPLIRTDPIIERAAAASGLPANVIRAGAGADADRFTLTAATIGRADARDQARAIAQAVAEGLTQFVADEQEANGIPVEERFEFKIVAPASPAAKISPTTERVGAVSATAGLIAALAFYVTLSLRAPPPRDGSSPRSRPRAATR